MTQSSFSDLLWNVTYFGMTRSSGSDLLWNVTYFGMTLSSGSGVSFSFSFFFFFDLSLFFFLGFCLSSVTWSPVSPSSSKQKIPLRTYLFVN